MRSAWKLGTASSCNSGNLLFGRLRRQIKNSWGIIYWRIYFCHSFDDFITFSSIWKIWEIFNVWLDWIDRRIGKFWLLPFAAWETLLHWDACSCHFYCMPLKLIFYGDFFSSSQNSSVKMMLWNQIRNWNLSNILNSSKNNDFSKENWDSLISWQMFIVSRNQ